MFCEKCGKPLNDGDKFCAACGAEQTASVAKENELNKSDSVPETVVQTAKEKKKAKPKKVFVFGAVALVLVACIVIGILVVPSMLGGSAKPFGGTIYTSESQEINFINQGAELSTEINDELYSSGESVYLTKDCKYLFYRNDESELYRALLSNGSNGVQKEKIGSDVSSYHPNSDGSKVVYFSDNDLYLSTIADKNKIGSDVSVYYCDENLSAIIYQTEEHLLYRVESGREKEKIASDANILSVSNDLSTVYYQSDSAIYKLGKTGAAQKIINDVCNPKASDNSNSSSASANIVSRCSNDFYYTVFQSSSIKYSDVVEDDMEDEDFSMEEPKYSDFDDYDDYLEARDEYKLKEARDDIRAILNSNIANSDGTYSLYYYDGSKTTLVAENVDGATNIAPLDKASAVIYKKETVDISKKVKMSELDLENNLYSPESALEQYVSTDEEYCVNYKGSEYNAENLNYEKLLYSTFSDVYLNPDTTELYYIDNDKALVKAPLNSNKIGKAEKIIDDAICFGFVNGVIYYFADGTSDSSTLYYDNKKVDDDVAVNYAAFVDGAITYATDVSDGRFSFTLKMYKNGETTKISDDVSSYWSLGSQNITYTRDNKGSSSSPGEVMRFNGRDSVKISDDSYLIPVFQNGVKMLQPIYKNVDLFGEFYYRNSSSFYA